MVADEALSGWLARELGLQDAYVSAELGGGNSNVTLLVESASGRHVIRRPPANTISPLAARGVRREHDVLRALEARAPLPRALAFCEDPAILGAPFAVVDFVPGVAITDRLPDAYAAGVATIDQLGTELIDALAGVHALPLADMTQLDWPRPDDFLRRQVERWLTIRAGDTVRSLPRLEQVGAALLEGLPADSPVTLVHGDFHLDNTLFSAEQPRLVAIIDWELATFGDPRLDLGLLLAFWGERPVPQPGFAFVQAVTRQSGIIHRETLAARWAAATGFAVDDLGYFCAFALWRLAAMVEGAYCLFRRGKVEGDYARNLEHDVPALLDEAAVHLQLDCQLD
ncbi:MAG: phosphotransferase family protein [Gammaproteobacteria bacterium]|nr:phosphotransferase family protein [Gammaproteobacteria bacterium]